MTRDEWIEHFQLDVAVCATVVINAVKIPYINVLKIPQING